MRKLLSFLFLTCCTTFLFNGCYFESDLFGSAAGTLKNESSLLAGSSHLPSDKQQLHSQKPDRQDSISLSDDTTSDLSSAPEMDSSSSPSEEILKEDSSPATSEPLTSDSSTSNDFISNNIDDSPLLNATLKTLGLKQRPDALALMLCSPLNGQLHAVPFRDSLSLSDSPITSFLLMPIYNNSTLEIYELSFDGENYTDDTLLYRKTASPSGYALDILLNPREEAAAFKVSIKYGNVSGTYIIVCDLLLYDHGEYLLKDNTLSPLDYVSDSLTPLTRKEALVSAITYITRDFSSSYNWEYISDSMIRLYIAPGDDPLSGEYFLESSELRDGKGCCYYAVSLSQRSYDESGNATGETIYNRYLVSLSGNQIIPMVDKEGNINAEYNDIII
ncbi:MAG: hypothetical protein E7487_01065 [Ruminococcaceae bacterium]|nr:hypothetical protein [Oscillospiraceae bacterium]